MTNRTKMTLIETETPNHAAQTLRDFRCDLNAHGRKHAPFHRTDVTSSVLLDRFPDVLSGALGLGFQIAAYRRVRDIRTKSTGPWRLACNDILGDLAQLLDPMLPREKAERIGRTAIDSALPTLQTWLDGESA